jgi:outer membrane protein assembly factor BamB
MECDQANQLIELYVLDELAPREARQLAAHLTRCPDCRRAVAEYREIIADIHLQTTAAAPRPEFARSLQQTLADETSRRTRRLRWRCAELGAGTAAAILVFTAALWQGQWPGSGLPHPTEDMRSQPSLRQAANVREVWRRGGAQALTASPADTVVIRSSSMYFLNREAAGDRVAAIEAATGNLLWQSRQSSRGFIAADNSRVYCLSSGQRQTDLIALDARDGSILWRYAPDGPGPGLTHSRAVCVNDGRICWTTRSAVHLVDTHTGLAVWKRAILGEGPLSAAATDGGLCVASTTSIRRLDIETGGDVWQEPLGGETRYFKRPLLALAGERAFLVLSGQNARSRLICLDLASRKRLWETPVGDTQHMLASGSGVYLRGNGVGAYDGRTGEPLWSRPAGGCGPMTDEQGLIHFVDTIAEGRLLALDSRTGAKAWEIAGIRSCGAFSRIGSTGFIKTHDGVIHAIAIRTQ